MNKDVNYKYVLNKIFTGSFLNHNLGHEIINFIKMDDKNRYIYVNPWGERCHKSAENTEYVFHIMRTTYQNESYYELIAVSKVSKDDVGYKENNKEETSDLKYKGFSIREIFKYNNSDDKSHLCTFKASTFYKPTKRILFLTGKDHADIQEKEVVIATLNCNPQHSRAYSREIDIKVLDKIVDKYLKVSNETEKLNQYEDELCYSIISDRTKLEDSLSNQLAYFLNRDKKILDLFIKNFLKLKIKDDFTIIREQNNIDLLLEGENNVIVIENKIDSGINGDQLKTYKKYINKKYSKKAKYFYILEPPYSSITESEKNKRGGEYYKIVYYDDLYKTLRSSTYNPNGKSSKYGDFLYREFIYTIEYIQMSKAAQQEKIAYTRLKQKINELKVKE